MSIVVLKRKLVELNDGFLGIAELVQTSEGFDVEIIVPFGSLWAAKSFLDSLKEWKEKMEEMMKT